MLFVSILMVISQSALAKITDFNALIKEQSKAQIELHESLNSQTAEKQENSEDDLSKKQEVIVLDTNHEVFSQAQVPKKNIKKAAQLKKKQAVDDIEQKHFLRLGEELNDAQ